MDERRTTPIGGLVLSLFVTQVGTAMTAVGAALLLVDRFGIGPETGLALAIQVVPNILLGPFVGELVTRWDPRVVAVASSAASATAVMAYPFAVTPQQAQIVALVVGLAVLPGIPSRMALRAFIVSKQDQQRVSGYIVAGERLALVLGPLVATLVSQMWGYSSVFYLEAVFAVFAGSVLFTLPPTKRPRQDKEREGRRAFSPAYVFKSSVQLVIVDRIVGEYTLTAVVYSVAVGFRRLVLPALALVGLRHDPHDLGLLLAALALGGIVGGLLVGKVKDEAAAAWYVGLTLIEALLWLVPLLMQSLEAAVVSLVLVGLCEGATTAVFFTQIQKRVDSREIGRYFSLLSPLTDAAIVGGLLLATSLKPPTLAWLGPAFIAACIGVPLTLCWRMLRDAARGLRISANGMKDLP